MAFHNTNYEAINLIAPNSYSAFELGDGISATTVHEIFCLQDGTIDITALGGGSFTWSATTGQMINIVTNGCNVQSGEFVGFRSKKSWQPYRTENLM